MAETILLRVEVDSKGAVTGVRNVERGMDRLDKTGAKAEGRMRGIGIAIKTFLGVAAVRVVARLGSQMIQLAKDGEETASKFQTVFGRMSESVDAFGRQVAHTMGLTQTEFRDIAATAGAIFQGFGLSLEDSARKTQEILSLSADLASFHNTTINEAFDAVVSGLTGMSRPLRQYGIVLRESMVQGSTEAEKATDRLRIVSELAGVAIGDLDRTADSATNTHRRLAAQLREARNVFADELLVAVTEVTKKMSDLAGEGDGLIRWARDAGREVAALAGTVSGVAFELVSMGNALSGTAGQGVGLVSVLKEVNRELRVVIQLARLFAILAPDISRFRPVSGGKGGTIRPGRSGDLKNQSVDAILSAPSGGGGGGGGGGLSAQAREAQRLAEALERAKEAANQLKNILFKDGARGTSQGDTLQPVEGAGLVVNLETELEEVIASLHEVGEVAVKITNDVGESVQQIALRQIGATGQLLGSLSNLFEAAGDEQSAFFAASKALAVAQAIISTYAAAAKALDVGGPIAGPILAAAAIAQGLAYVATIRNTNPGSSSGGSAGANVNTSTVSGSTSGYFTATGGQAQRAPIVNVGAPTVVVEGPGMRQLYSGFRLEESRIDRSLGSRG